MSTHNLPTRAVVGAAVVALWALAACASSGAKSSASPKTSSGSPSRYSTDTSSTLRTDGKSVEDLFAGRFPGVSVTRAEGGGLQIRIRGGSNTFYGSDEPLIVVDETPIPSGSHGVVMLNPSDIQKIEVLKNPADLAIYGIRGGNGVVKITTKRPGRR